MAEQVTLFGRNEIEKLNNKFSSALDKWGLKVYASDYDLVKPEGQQNSLKLFYFLKNRHVNRSEDTIDCRITDFNSNLNKRISDLEELITKSKLEIERLTSIKDSIEGKTEMLEVFEILTK